MAIIPEDITTLRIDQLPTDAITPTSTIAHGVGTELKKDNVQSLIDLVSTAIGAGSGVGYLALSVTDGQQLPDVPENPSFFLCGAGTYLNVGGYADVVCTEQLNAVMSLTDHWELAVGIPIITISPTPSLQEVTDVGNTTTNLINSTGGIETTVDGTIGVFLDVSGSLLIGTNGFYKVTIMENVTDNRIQYLSDRNGIQCVVDPADNFTNDTTAAAGGVNIGQYYHTAGVVKIRLT